MSYDIFLADRVTGKVVDLPYQLRIVNNPDLRGRSLKNDVQVPC